MRQEYGKVINGNVKTRMLPNREFSVPSINRVCHKVQKDGLLSAAFAVLRWAIGYNTFNAYQKRKKLKRILSLNRIDKRFELIYDTNYWGSRESGSGPGSEISSTNHLRKWLKTQFKELNINTIVDAPCGDFNWMHELQKELNLNYFGFDIVPSVIKRNQSLYASKNVRFAVSNICEDNLPKCDLLFVRDCLIHLSFSDIDRFFRNISKVEYTYLITTTHDVGKSFVNRDILSGDFRLIDLFSHPFGLDRKNVIKKFDDMIVIQKKDVPKLLPNL